MGINSRSFIRSTLLSVPAMVLILAVSIANGQTSSSAQAQEEQAQEEVATVVNSSASAPTSNGPVFTEYRGISIGMTAEEVRAKVDRLEKGTRQDFLSFSDQESAQIYYDDNGKVMAISVDYFGDIGNAPSSMTVLGVPLQAKPDGSMYQLKRYPKAGYWVSYNRTAGDKPIISITMQKM